MKKNKKEKEGGERYITICPKCGSTDVIPAPSKIVGAGFRPLYICQDCSYTSFIFPEFPESGAEEVIKKIKAEKSTITSKKEECTKRPKKGAYTETAYGELVVHGWWKFAGPFFLITGLIIYFLTLGGYLYAGPTGMKYALLTSSFLFVLYGLFATYVGYFPSKVNKIFKKHPIIKYMVALMILSPVWILGLFAILLMLGILE